MVVGGFQRFSLVDYPDEACSVIFTQGCNFRCPFCYNRSLVLPEEFTEPIDENYILSFLEGRRSKVKSVTITGGEPTIFSDLPLLIEKLKGIGLKVKLDTQGSNPYMLSSIVHSLDYVAMDVKTSPCNYHKVVSDLSFSAIRDSIKILAESSVFHEFRTTCVPTLVEVEDIESIVDELPNESKYILQNYLPNVGTLKESFAYITPYTKEQMMVLLDVALSKGQYAELRDY